MILASAHSDFIHKPQVLKQQTNKQKTNIPLLWGREHPPPVLNTEAYDRIPNSGIPSFSLCQQILTNYLFPILDTGQWLIVPWKYYRCSNFLVWLSLMLEKWVVTSPDTTKMELNILLKIGCLVKVSVINSIPVATHSVRLRSGINVLMFGEVSLSEINCEC